MEELSPYLVMGLAPQASLGEIKQRYRERVKVCHPDLGNDPDRVEAFKRLTWAYRLLCDPASRAAFDHAAGIKHDTPGAPPPPPPLSPEMEKRQTVRDALATGREQIAAGAHAEAEQIARLALRRDRTNPEAYLLLAEALIGQERAAEARGCLNLALQMNPRHPDAARIRDLLQRRQSSSVQG